MEDSGIQRILEGEIFTLNGDASDIERYEKEMRAKLTSDVATDRPGIDIRAVWEPARLQHVTAVIAHALSRIPHEGGAHEIGSKGISGARMTELRCFVEKTLLRWIDGNDFLRGPHYLSAMECGLRIPVFLYGFHLLQGSGRAARERIADAIYRHAWWISRRLSLHASLGNHTLCECVGLVFAGALYIQTRQGKRWLGKAVQLLEREVAHQILPDGGPAEQSLNYHRFVLDLCWLALDFLEANGLHDCGAMKGRLQAGESFYGAFRNCEGHVPQIGDSDDGCALAPAVHARRTDHGSISSPCIHFPASGYTLFRGIKDSLLTFDHGPLGMPPLYNHGHADALSITLSVSGKPVIVDPGTYRYNGEPPWRAYFKGTRAHNTVTVDGLDQAVQETGFIWSRPYESRVVRRLEHEDGWIVEAEHNGYARLPNPVFHRRCIGFWQGRAAVVRDSFRGRGVHGFELNFHAHPEASVDFDEPWWCVVLLGAPVFVRLLVGEGMQLLCGRPDPPLGWFSDAYGRKRPTGVLQASDRGVPEQIQFLTVICWDRPLSETELLAAVGLQSSFDVNGEMPDH
jgi:hypothetical protein